MRFLRFLFIIMPLVFGWLLPPARGQQLSDADSLNRLSAIILGNSSVDERLKADSLAMKIVEQMLTENLFGESPLQLPEAFARFTSSDGSLTVINWVFPLRFNTFSYRLIVATRTQGGIRITRLTDRSLHPESQRAIHHGEHWFGALYYQMIEKKTERETLCFFLGWNRSEEGFQTKIAEVISVDKATGLPIIGKRVFPGNLPRYLLSYSSKASLSMKATVQFRSAKRGLFGRQKTFREEMIVFNRLAASDKRFSHNPRFVYPSGNVFDALAWERGRWILLHDIDARNEPRKADDAPPPDQLNLRPL